jgi:coenzyme F420-reducing hydrogenase alpha subunit
MIIEPVTRIEGNAGIEIRDGKVLFKVVELRGFEKFLEGRPFEELPRLTARICGICPVSHTMASVKAIESAFSIEVPERAEMLRRLLVHAQAIQSHTLHLFFLALPDYYPIEDKNVLGLYKANGDLVRSAVFLRELSQNMVETMAVRAVHPEVIPGGVTRDLDDEKAHKFLSELKKALNIADELGTEVSDLFKEGKTNIETCYLSLSNNGNVDFYDGEIVSVDENGNELIRFLPLDYSKYIQEKVEPFSYLKFPYLEGKMYRVGPLARLNVAKVDTDIASELQKGVFGNIRHETTLYNYARFIELVYSIEKAIEILENLKAGRIREEVKIRAGEGVGVVEAPRGALFHHYKFNDKGLLEWTNLVVATVQNNPAINAELNEVYTKDGADGLETIVRAYDPCLSCASH